MREFLALLVVLTLAACGPDNHEVTPSNEGTTTDYLQPAVLDGLSGFDSVFPHTPRLTSDYKIPSEDFVTARTVILSDGSDCQVPRGSMVAGEENSDGAVYIAVIPDDADQAFTQRVCAEGRSIMSRVDFVKSFM